MTGGFDAEAALAAAFALLPGCSCAALADISAGQLLALQTDEAASLDQTGLMGPVIQELFEGAAASCIATMWRPHRPDAAGFTNIIIQAPDLLQIFMRLRPFPDYAVLFAWNDAPNLGIALSKANAALASIEAAFG